MMLYNSESFRKAFSDGDVSTIRNLLICGCQCDEKLIIEEGEDEDRSEISNDCVSLLSLASSAGYLELAQVLLAMHANVEDRGIKGDCTPLMEAASAGHVDIVRLLIAHGADVNAQSSSGNTPLMYGCAGGYEDVVRVLLAAGSNIEEHNENGHTPLMEAASAGHVNVSQILLEHGAGINTHSNEFKESALTLACYKGHLNMVRFLLNAGADQEHKTDEMHTALMEASMDGHVEVARLLLDSGAQVNMPTDSFESPLTLAACGGHVDLAMLLIERGANIEEVNDEGYTPLMEAAREGHEEMVALLLSQGASINAQTEETQETALTLACCGGFLEVADFLIKAGADLELGASTPLMEAAQEGHIDLVRYLLESSAHVHAQTQTGDTALTYACENGHTDVANLLLQYGADLEHESEGGRTPLMKACRAGHLCTVQFLLQRNANVNRQTTNNDHTPLSLACAGGHLAVVELLLSQSADPFHKLKDNSTMLIEAAKGGHTSVVQLLLDYPHSIMTPPSHSTAHASQQTADAVSYLGLHEVPEAVRVMAQDDERLNEQPQTEPIVIKQQKRNNKSRSNTSLNFDNNLTSAEAQQVRTQPVGDCETNSSVIELLCEEDNSILDKGSTPPTPGVMEYMKARKQEQNAREEQILQKKRILEELHRVEREFTVKAPNRLLLKTYGMSLTDDLQSNTAIQNNSQLENPPPPPPQLLNIDMGNNQPNPGKTETPASTPLTLAAAAANATQQLDPSVVFVPSSHSTFANLPPIPAAPPLPLCATEVSQSTAISDRPKAKPVSKKEGKNQRKANYPALQQLKHNQQHLHQINQQLQQQVLQQQQQIVEAVGNSPNQTTVAMIQHLQQHHQPRVATQSNQSILSHMQLLQQHTPQQLQQQVHQVLQQTGQQLRSVGSLSEQLTEQQRCQLFEDEDKLKQDVAAIRDLDAAVEDVVQTLETFSLEDVANVAAAEQEKFQVAAAAAQHAAKLRGLPFDTSQIVLDEAMLATQLQNVVVCNQQQPTPEDVTRVEYFAVPTSDSTQPSLAVQHASGLQFQYQQYQLTTGLQVATSGIQQFQGTPPPVTTPDKAGSNAVATQEQIIESIQQANMSQRDRYRAGIQMGMQFVQKLQLGACPATAAHELHVQCGTQTTPAPQVAHVPPPAIPPPDKKSVKSEGGGKSKKRLQTSRQHAAGHHHSSRQQDNVGQQYASGHNQGYNAAQNIVQQQTPATAFSCMDVDSETDSNHDTALTLACAGGHEELVELLLSRGADIEHRDKKGFTPLILAATAGHDKVVEILLNHSADLEAQSERTKDTPLSLACSGGRYEVVELLLSRGANKEHRNVSDYTPLSLAASGGYVNIIKLLLTQGAEINSRTGSKLGISPLMLAAMNGHTAAVKMLLDMGSDINAQIETNRNTALTLACFQGRHEVVSLLLDRKANVEHRAKTGLTPLMEAASGGYVDVGRVLLDKGADVNATPVPSSRDTALTIAADKGHCRFVELLLTRGASVEVKNKKGNSPLWLAANGGHLNVVELLYCANADIDSQDNRKVSCLMAAFRKGHIKAVRWMVGHVTQFPSDQEMMRFISTLSDKELLEKCHECVKIIREAKEMQAAKANKNATILLEELDMEKNREESKKAAAARRRERKKKKKLEKKEEKRKLHEENKKNELSFDEKETKKKELVEDKDDDDDGSGDNTPNESPVRNSGEADKEEGDSGIDANSQGSCSSNEVKAKEKRKEKKKKKNDTKSLPSSQDHSHSSPAAPQRTPTTSTVPATPTKPIPPIVPIEVKEEPKKEVPEPTKVNRSTKKGSLIFEASRHPCDREDFEATGSESYPMANIKGKKLYMHYESENPPSTSQKVTSPKQPTKREEGWKEVVRKSSVQTVSTFESGTKKVSVPLNAISRVIGRGGSNINAIRGATGAHIEVEKQSKGQGERNITIKGSAEATRQAHSLIATLIKDPEADILQIIPKTTKSVIAFSTWDKTTPAAIQTLKAKTTTLKSSTVVTTTSSSTVVTIAKSSSTITPLIPSMRTSTVKMGTSFPSPINRTTAPRLVAAAEKRAAAAAQMAGIGTKSTMSYTTAIMAAGRGTTKVVTTSTGQTFAAKLTETTPTPPVTVTNIIIPPVTPIKPKVSPKPVEVTSQAPTPVPVVIQSPKHRPQTTASAPPTIMPCSNKVPFPRPEPVTEPQFLQPRQEEYVPPVVPPIKTRSMEYSLFDTFPKVVSQWDDLATTPIKSRKFETDTPQVDASKAPGYRGTAVCSPVSKAPTPPSYQSLAVSRPISRPAPIEIDPYRNMYPMETTNFKTYEPKLDLSFHQMQFHHQQIPPTTSSVTTSRLNPRAPDFSLLTNKSNQFNPSYQIPVQYNKTYPTQQHQQQPQQQQQQPQQQRPQQQRWQFVQQNTFQPADMMCLPHDYLTMENNSPNMSPNSADRSDERLQQMKVPRPIGTERAWKNNYQMVPPQQQQLPATINQLGAADLNEAAASMWLLNNEASKLTLNSWPNIAAAAAAATSNPMDSRGNMFRPYTNYNHRLPTDDLPTIDPTFSHLDSQNSGFPNGTSMSLMHTLQQQYNVAAAAAAGVAAGPPPPDMDLGMVGSNQGGGNGGGTNWDDKQQHVSRLGTSDVLLQRNPHY